MDERKKTEARKLVPAVGSTSKVSNKPVQLFPSFASINVHEIQKKLRARLPNEAVCSKIPEVMKNVQGEGSIATKETPMYPNELEEPEQVKSFQVGYTRFGNNLRLITENRKEVTAEKNKYLLHVEGNDGCPTSEKTTAKENNTKVIKKVQGEGSIARKETPMYPNESEEPEQVKSFEGGNTRFGNNLRVTAEKEKYLLHVERNDGCPTSEKTTAKEKNTKAKLTTKTSGSGAKSYCMANNDQVIGEQREEPCNVISTDAHDILVMLDQISGDEDDENCEEEDYLVKQNQEYIFPTPEEVENSVEPYVGMTFDSLQEAHRYVNVHGLINGYAVHKGSNYKQKRIQLQCNKSGKQKDIDTAQRKRRRNTIMKTNCKMTVTVKLIKDRWEITSVQCDHNHPLVSTPSLTKFFINHKIMSEEEKTFSKILQGARIPPRKIMAIFRELKGSFKQISWTTKNLDNLQQKEKRRSDNTDIENTLKYLNKFQMEHPGFYYTMKTDKDNTVQSIFWTDARSRMDYELYGDFVSFDTTFSTNRYNMPFAPIVGINGNGNNILFGCALLENQKADTFGWLFKAFLEVMNGKKPALIMTDQDSAMRSSIKEILPGTLHRLCVWHIWRNIVKHCSFLFSQKKGMEKELKDLIYDTLSIQEFEEGSKNLMAVSI
ncbi:hypothetical protein ACP70R_032900 [Stipagrostis hirtigluma subsp. patula]